MTQLAIAYRVPATTTPETRAIAVGSQILCGGESSRLYQKLVKEKEVVRSVFCGVDGRAGPSKLEIQAMVRPGKKPEEVEALISEEVARFLSAPVTEKELERTRAGILRSAVAPRESVLSTAISLADNTALFNDPNRINTEYRLRLALTAPEIQKAAQTYLRTTNRVVIVTQPAPAAAPQPAGLRQN